MAPFAFHRRPQHRGETWIAEHDAILALMVFELGALAEPQGRVAE